MTLTAAGVDSMLSGIADAVTTISCLRAGAELDCACEKRGPEKRMRKKNFTMTPFASLRSGKGGEESTGRPSLTPRRNIVRFEAIGLLAFRVILLALPSRFRSGDSQSLRESSSVTVAGAAPVSHRLP